MAREERNIRVEAVVLRHSDWGEADRLLSLFTRERGKLRAIAKGVRRMRSRKAGHLEPFTRVTLMLAKGRDLWIVTQAETVDAYLPLREDLDRTAQAAYAVELLDRFTFEEGASPQLYDMLTRALDRISNLPDPFLALRYYEIQLLETLGFRPELNHCIRCGNEIQPQDQFFSPSQGGVVCPDCAPQSYDLRPISLPALKYMRHLQRSSWAEATRASVPPGVRSEMEEHLQAYITFLLERSMNTPAFLRMVRRGPQESAEPPDDHSAPGPL